MERQKNYEELTIRDHFMFGKICSKPENRKLILDSLLQIDFREKEGTGTIEKRIKFISIQQQIYQISHKI